MAEFSKLKKMIQSALRQSAEESSLLLNQELTVQDTAVLEFGKKSYLDDMEDSAFVVPVESREDYPGRFHMVFALRDAILMSGILLGIPPARISEKRKLLILEADDIDAFSEIANQIIGSFNSVFQPCLPQKVHLKQLPPMKFVPQVDAVTDETPLPEGEYIAYKVQMTLGSEELNRFDILVPLPLARLFDPQEDAVSDAAAEGDVHDQAESLRRLFPGEDSAGEEPGAYSGAVGRVLVLEDDEKDREQIRSLLDHNGFTAVAADLGVDVTGLFGGEHFNAVVIGTAKAEEWSLSLCSRIHDLNRTQEVPIIMCAQQWTRTCVLKAVKSGARDILVKPYDGNELLAKLARFQSSV